MRRFWVAVGMALCALAALGVASSALADNGNERASQARAFGAVMSGPREVPPTTSTSEGLASFLLSQDGASLYYALEVTGASSVVNAAHMHLARADRTGDVVVTLCGAGPAPACSTEGVLAVGFINSASLVGPLAGQSLNDLLSAMRAGGTYVNVHTANYPDGELRGQVQPLAGGGEKGRGHGHENNNHENEDD